MKKFLLVDDHMVVRSGIKTILSEIYKQSEIQEAVNGETVIQKLNEHQFDLILLDIHMPRTDTLALLEHIHKNYSGAKVLMFSMSAENIYAKRFIKAGAMGFVSKESPLEEITNAINIVLNNKKYISKALAEKLAEDSISGKPENPFNSLSPKEFEILSLILSGKTVTEIAGSQHLHTSTIGTHKARILEKMGAKNILELKELATMHNL